MERLTGRKQDFDCLLAYLADRTNFDATRIQSILFKCVDYEDTGLTPDEIEQNKEYIQILEKENKLIKEQYIKEADTVDCYKKLATENAKLKELIKELGWTI